MKKKVLTLLCLFLLGNCAPTTASQLEKYFSYNPKNIDIDFETSINPKVIFKITNDANEIGRDMTNLAPKYEGGGGYSMVAITFCFGDREPSRVAMEEFAKSKNFSLTIFYIFHDTAAVRAIENNELKEGEISRFETVPEEGSNACWVSFYSKAKNNNV